MDRKAFTLIELLVVIAIIAILAAILFPVFTRARESSKRSACLSNCKQLASAMQMYIDDWKGRFPSFTYSEQWKQLEPQNIVSYTKSEEVFHCPGATDINSARVPPTKTSENWKNYFGRNMGDPPRWKWTDYKMMDNGYLPGMSASEVRSPVWLVVCIDNTDWWPRHPSGTATKNYNDGGSNIAFLDGHAAYFVKERYNDGNKRSGPDVDDAGATPFWNWGLPRDYWIPE